MGQYFTSNFWEELLSKLTTWTITELPGIMITLVILWVLLKMVKFLTRKLRKFLIKRADNIEAVDNLEAEKKIKTLTGIVHSSIKVTLITIFSIMILSKFGLNIGPLLASAGILGLAVGFGAQELVRDYISGFFMLLENQIRTGDVAIINGTAGLVEQIELRTITLRDLSGVVHIFQNGKISSLSNMTKNWSAVVLNIGVAYKENLDKVSEVMRQVGNQLLNEEPFSSKILEPLEIFGLEEFADSALIIKARIKTRPGEQWTIGREYRGRLKKAFDKENIEIPFPHTTIYWGEEIAPLELTMNPKQKQ